MCHISFPGKYEILNHGKKDHNGKMFFEENGVLKRLWTFKCSICPSEFSLQGGTIEHIKKIHDIQKLYCCNDCQAYFTQNGLNDHRIKVHQEENFTCPICNVEFSKIENFQSHQCSKKEATVKEKMIEKNDTLNETKIKTKPPTLVMPHKITPIQATPTHVIPINSTPSQVLPIQAKPTHVIPIQATPTQATPTLVLPTNTLETANKLSNDEINNVVEQDPLLMDTPTQATPTEATPTQAMHTDTLETVIKTENDKTLTVDEQDPLLVESRELTEKSLVSRENSTFSQLLGENSDPNENVFENRTAIIIRETENTNGYQIEKDPLMIQSDDFLIPTETESNENDATEIKNKLEGNDNENNLMKNNDEIKEKETPISTEETVPENKNNERKRTFPVEKRFMCPKCNITFKSKTFLESHMYRHNLVHVIDDLKKPHPCLNCPKRFVKPIDLEKHIKKDHEEKNCEKNSPKQVENHNGKADLISDGIFISGRSSIRLTQ